MNLARSTCGVGTGVGVGIGVGVGVAVGLGVGVEVGKGVGVGVGRGFLPQSKISKARISSGKTLIIYLGVTTYSWATAR